MRFSLILLLALTLPACTVLTYCPTLQAADAPPLPWSASAPMDIPTFTAIQQPQPSVQVRYGSEATQVIDVFLPHGKGRFPVVVLLHGGCWSAKTAGREQLRALGADLAQRGIAVWSIGYRRVDEPGGGYPGIYRDTAKAIDLLAKQAPHYRLDLERSVLVGHSAGAHLALWAAGRNRLPPDSPLYAEHPFVPRKVVSLGGVGDLKKFAPLVPGICGKGIVENLLPAPRGQGADTFADVSPSALGITDAQVVMVSGVLDRLVPPFVAYDYATAVRGRIDVELVNVEGAGHFDLVAPGRYGWEVARAKIEAAVGNPR